ncbi:MAG: hypothetical protein V3V18_07050 [Methylococcales bacterium]
MKKYNKLIILLSLTCSLTLISIGASQAAIEAIEDKQQPAEASKASNGSTVVDYLAIAGSGFGSLLYTPIKFASALILGITGGLSLIGTVPTGSEKNSIDIVKLGISGDWWVSPDHVRGTTPLKFMAPAK